MRVNRVTRLLVSPSALVLAVGVALAGAATQIPTGSDRGADLDVTASASGRLAVRTLHVSESVGFTFERLIPGDRGVGTVTLTNDGEGAGSYVLDPGTVQDIAGVLGGVLSSELELAVHDVTSDERLLFAGKLGALVDQLPVGDIAEGASRTLRFTIDWQDGGELQRGVVGDDNVFMGSRAEVLYEFRVTRAPERERSGDDEDPDPATEPAPAVAPVLIQSSAASARGCVSRRRFPIRVRVPRGFRAVSTRIFVDGKRVEVLRGRRLRAVVDLRRKVPGRFKVEIAVRGANGRTIVGTRRYRTCVPQSRSTRASRAPKV
jgi:hypothetical protein